MSSSGGPVPVLFFIYLKSNIEACGFALTDEKKLELNLNFKFFIVKSLYLNTLYSVKLKDLALLVFSHVLES